MAVARKRDQNFMKRQIQKKRRGLFLLCLLLVLSSVFAVGCRQKKEQTVDPENGSYLVYYQGNSYQLLTEVRQIDARGIPEKATALFEEMKNPPAGLRGGSVFPEEVTLSDVRYEGQILYVTVSAAMQSLTGAQAVNCRAALVRTMTQIPGVDYIYIYAGNQPLMDESGSPVGNLSSNNFVNVVGRDVNTMNHVTMTLYFADETGQYLKPVAQSAVYSNAFSIEEYAIQQLLEAPQSEDGYCSALPAGTQLLSVSTRDGVCYVNFSEELLTEQLPCKDTVAVYSVVNTLTTLPSISRVQIMIAGKTNVSIGSISLSDPLARNMDYVEVESD